MKKSDENKHAFLFLSPAEEMDVLLSFENYVRNYKKEEKGGTYHNHQSAYNKNITYTSRIYLK